MSKKLNKAELDKLRKEVDAVDKVILAALAKRAKLSKIIGAYKLEKGLKALDKTRKEQLIKSRVAMGKALNVSTKLAQDLFTRIHKNSLEIQKRLKK